MNQLPYASIAAALATFAGLAPATSAQSSIQLPQGFGTHWFQGKAELNTYTLEQSRYGETRKGKAVVIFVTEDFDPKALVKDEDGRGPSVGVLKMNQIRRFTTGVYDYSMMLSTFTQRQSASGPRTLKTTASVQDWCGHAWLQMDRRGDGFGFTGHSYFEGENQESGKLAEVTLLEDELLTRVRLGPKALPTGQVQAVPSSFDSRLRHYPLQVETASAKLGSGDGDSGTYTLTFPRLRREVIVRFGAAFPHTILGWEEVVGGRTTAKATLSKTEMAPYWSQNGERDAGRRAPLGLPKRDL